MPACSSSFPECDFISPAQVRVGTFSLFWVGSANHDAIEPGRHSVYGLQHRQLQPYYFGTYSSGHGTLESRPRTSRLSVYPGHTAHGDDHCLDPHRPPTPLRPPLTTSPKSWNRLPRDTRLCMLFFFSNKRDDLAGHTKQHEGIEKRALASESHAEDFKSDTLPLDTLTPGTHTPDPALDVGQASDGHTSRGPCSVTTLIKPQPPTQADPVLPAVPTPPSVLRAQSAPLDTRAHRVGGVDVTLTTASASQSNSSIPHYIQQPTSRTGPWC